QPPLSSRLSTFVPTFNLTNPNLVDFPPKFQPIAAKPLFFDLAFNGIEHPKTNIERRKDGLPRLEKGQEASGGKGLWASLWGR
ncbi:signal recognition particle subunit srp68, partial [Rhizophlyctis rosea]